MVEIKSLKRKMNTNVQDFSFIKGSILSKPSKSFPFLFSFYNRKLNYNQLLSFTAKCNFWIRKYYYTLTSSSFFNRLQNVLHIKSTT